MNTPFYWPYDEVTAEISEDQQQLIIKAPWLQATLPVSAKNESVAVQLVAKFQSQSLSKQDLDLVSSLFQTLHKYPFCYTLPTQNRENATEVCDNFELVDRDLLSLSPHELLLATVRKSESQEGGLTEEEGDRCSQQLIRDDWEWDAKTALEFAKLGQVIHPESLLSVVRRFHLLEVMEHDEGIEIFKKIESLPAPSYQRIVGLLLRQNHYVTEQCQSSLAPALQVSGQARQRVAAFMAEEKGHDLILGAALKALTDDPRSIPVCLATRTLMHLLRFVAGRNLLAFAMVIDMFERSSYESMDPLAKLLSKGGFGKAASQVNRHKEINDAGGHENVAASFLAFMAPCEPAYAYEAVRLAELVSMVSNSVTSSAWRLFHETASGS